MIIDYTGNRGNQAGGGGYIACGERESVTELIVIHKDGVEGARVTMERIHDALLEYIKENPPQPPKRKLERIPKSKYIFYNHETFKKYNQLCDRVSKRLDGFDADTYLRLKNALTTAEMSLYQDIAQKIRQKLEAITGGVKKSSLEAAQAWWWLCQFHEVGGNYELQMESLLNASNFLEGKDKVLLGKGTGHKGGRKTRTYTEDLISLIKEIYTDRPEAKIHWVWMNLQGQNHGCISEIYEGAEGLLIICSKGAGTSYRDKRALKRFINKHEKAIFKTD